MWVVRVRLNSDNELVCDEKEKQSIVLNNEHVFGMLEYATNKLIVTVHPNVVILITNWAVC